VGGAVTARWILLRDPALRPFSPQCKLIDADGNEGGYAVRRLTVFFVAIALIITATPAAAIDLSRGIMYDVPDDVMRIQFGRIPPSILTREDSLAMAAYRFTGDTVRILVIPVDWVDRPALYSRSTLDSLMFSHGAWPGGSVAEYFEEVSYGQVTVTGTVLPWFTAGTYSPYFNFESVLPAIDPTVDFSDYDGDGDGVPDVVVFLRSQTGMEDTGDPNDIWSYAYSYPIGYGPGPYDGVYISRWNTSPEAFPLRDTLAPIVFSGELTVNKIRVFAHESSHSLGLPDLYDYDDKLIVSTYTTPGDGNDHPFVDWCLMGYAGYGIMSIRTDPPTHLSGWCKKELGWNVPIVLNLASYNDLVIYNIETRQDSSLYKIPIDEAEGEYFLLEYRNPNSTAMFDKFDSDFSCYLWPALKYGNDPLERGLLISHVHDSLGANYHRINYGLPAYPHYTVAVEDAGYNPAFDYTHNPEGNVSDSAQWWYPYETRKAAVFTSEVPGKEVFGPTTTPNSDGYSGPTGIIVQVDSIVDDRLYVNISRADADGDGVADPLDNCPVTPNPGQENSDGDAMGDACDPCPFDSFNDIDGDSFCADVDNCPVTPNADQLDYDEDGVGDACDNCDSVSNWFQENADADAWGDSCDNCPNTYSETQENFDGDAWGDACDLCDAIALPTNIAILTGDATQDGTLTSSDIIYLVNHVFKSGPAPNPIPRVGDVNCDGVVTSADIIYMVIFVFKSGPSPCDICAPEI